MPNYQSLYTGAEHDMYVTKAALIDLIYPVGAIYISYTNINPSDLFGGTWEEITGRFLLAQDNSHAAQSTGGEETHTLTINEAPSHTHTRGTMNITGWVGPLDDYSAHSIGGAMYVGSAIGYDATSTNTSGGGWTLGFDASRTWSGETSSRGGGAAHNNMPPYLAVYMWRRTA